MLISVIIPSRNRAHTLKRTLGSLYESKPSFAFEVIVVDNGSTDDTAEVCGEFNDLPWNLTYVYDAEPGLLTGRHLGAKQATGDILCFLDDDVEIQPTWFDGILEVFDDPLVQLATGPCLPKYTVSPPEWMEHFWVTLPGMGRCCAWLSLMDFGKKPKRIDPNFVWGLNFCIRKSALYAAGGFHPDNVPAAFQVYQGDGETGLTHKAEALGYTAVYHPGIGVFHAVAAERMTLEYFKKRAFYQGVCDSFTALRKTHLLQMPSRYEGDRGLNLWNRLRTTLSALKSYLSNPKVHRLKTILQAEELRGFRFHQEAFATDSRVRAWVLKPDYWNYQLPR